MSKDPKEEKIELLETELAALRVMYENAVEDLEEVEMSQRLAHSDLSRTLASLREIVKLSEEFVMASGSRFCQPSKQACRDHAEYVFRLADDAAGEVEALIDYSRDAVPAVDDDGEYNDE